MASFSLLYIIFLCYIPSVLLFVNPYPEAPNVETCGLVLLVQPDVEHLGCRRPGGVVAL